MIFYEMGENLLFYEIDFTLSLKEENIAIFKQTLMNHYLSNFSISI